MLDARKLRHKLYPARLSLCKDGGDVYLNHVIHASATRLGVPAFSIFAVAATLNMCATSSVLALVFAAPRRFVV